jgi:MscS family membrane protein
MSRTLSLLLTLCLLLIAAPSAATTKKPGCKTPREAANSVFSWQRPKNRNLDFASACFETKGRTAAELQQVAIRLKLVYDAHGAWILMDKISDASDYEDGDHNPQVIPHSDIHDVMIERQGDRWVWTATSLDRVDQLFDEVGAFVKVAQRLPRAFHDVVIFGVALWQYLSLLFLVALGLVARKLIAAVVASRIKKAAKRLGQQWPIKIIDVIASPGATLVTAIILRIGYPQLILPVDWSKALASTVRVLVTISLVWAAYRCVDLLAAKLSERAETTDSKLDDQLVPLLRKTLKVMVFIVGTLIVLQNLEFDVTTLFASVSIGGLALGLAAKDTLANLFGSISIFVDSPFQIGDWINVGGVDGTVEEVGFRSTRMRTFYDSIMVMPNAKLADANIDNYGLRKYRRCFVTLGLTYDTSPEQMQAFVEGVRAVIQSNPTTRKDYYEVCMSGFGDSALEVMTYFFFECDTWTDELNAKHDIFLEFMRLARDLGVVFAFPTQSLHIESQAQRKERTASTPPSEKTMRDIVEAYGPGGERARPDGVTITESRFMPVMKSERGAPSEDGDG